MATIMKRVAFVCTGEELVIGDIEDTNSTFFAQQFVKNDIHPGQRVIVGDDETEIENAIRYLQPLHQTIITIGGLGPTSDDRTRYALSKALNCPLVFYDSVWQWIVDRVNQFTQKKSEITENNRQQAWFPEGSQPIFNANGTAAACYLQHDGKDIFMLPGPPNECRPIFQEVVLPLLQKQNYPYKIYRRSWLLFGVSESKIADQLEKIERDPNCALGYRVHYPYLEIKLWSNNEIALNRISKKFDIILAPYLAKGDAR